MWFFYVFACLPVAVGAYFWVRTKKVVWWEWLAGTGLGFAMAILFQYISVLGMTEDVETWSGSVSSTTFHPKWVEQYTQIHTSTDSKGNTKTWTTTEYRTHRKFWECKVNYGRGNFEKHRISQPHYQQIVRAFGGKIVSKKGRKPGFHRGDRNIYVTTNETNVIIPSCKTVPFENRVGAAPSLFSFAKVPESIPVHPYPENNNWDRSDRLIGATGISPKAWDQMNARLGPRKKVNVILIYFGDKDSQYGHYQEAAWVGGKKNDLVLCKGNNWSYVFGWTEKEIVKRNLETILLENELTPEIIPKIEQEIVANYQIKDWDKFDYITVEPPRWTYLIFIVVLAGAQTGFWIWAHKNERDKTWKMEG